MMTDPLRPTSKPPPTPGTSRGSPSPADSLWQSHELLRGGREVLIAHQEEIYRLRLTRNGKLILTK
jgi:hemin uptake protein HemP